MSRMPGRLTKNERMQRAWRLYEEANNQAPASAREVAEWAVEQGILSPPRVDPISLLADDMAKALREEYATDAYGRRYRVNHAVRYTRGAAQHTMWAKLENAERPYMQRAFHQRREQIVGDCVQLRIDVDAYNDLSSRKNPIPLLLDFTEDVEERLTDTSEQAA